MIIAQNNLQFILEVAILVHLGILFLFNLLNVSLRLALSLSLLLTMFLSLIFSLDTLCLFLPFVSHQEFTHAFGPLSILGWVTLTSGIQILRERGVTSPSLSKINILLFFIILIAGGIMHRSFLLMWLLGVGIGYYLISKCYKTKTKIKFKTISYFVVIALTSFTVLEILSRILNLEVLSPSVRISRVEKNIIPSLQMVLPNIRFWGHVPGSCHWGSECLGGADGYITLPVTLIHFLRLPYHIFYGILVNQKDYIDYMLPGIFAVAFDGGYFSLLFLLVWIAFVTILASKILKKYKEKRSEGSTRYLGREALLIGSLSAFISQSMVGLFVVNRSFNESALLTYIIISALTVAHVIKVEQ